MRPVSCQRAEAVPCVVDDLLVEAFGDQPVVGECLQLGGAVATVAAAPGKQPLEVDRFCGATVSLPDHPRKWAGAALVTELVDLVEEINQLREGISRRPSGVRTPAISPRSSQRLRAGWLTPSRRAASDGRTVGPTIASRSPRAGRISRRVSRSTARSARRSLRMLRMASRLFGSSDRTLRS